MSDQVYISIGHVNTIRQDRKGLKAKLDLVKNPVVVQLSKYGVGAVLTAAARLKINSSMLITELQHVHYSAVMTILLVSMFLKLLIYVHVYVFLKL